MGVWSRLRGKSREEAPGILKKRPRATSWAGALERYGEAAGIAQEGQTEQARGLVSEFLSEPRKILVVTGQSGASLPLRGYALSLAGRMGCEVWHLVCTKAGFSSPWERNGWGDEASIPHKEIFLEGDMSSCIQKALERLKRVEFILMETEQGPERLEVAVPVFTLLSQVRS